MRYLDEGGLKIVSGGHLDETNSKSATIAAGATLTGGAAGCLAGGFFGPTGVLVGCGVGAAIGLGIVHHIVASYS